MLAGDGRRTRGRRAHCGTAGQTVRTAAAQAGRALGPARASLGHGGSRPVGRGIAESAKARSGTRGEGHGKQTGASSGRGSNFSSGSGSAHGAEYSTVDVRATGRGVAARDSACDSARRSRGSRPPPRRFAASAARRFAATNHSRSATGIGPPRVATAIDRASRRVAGTFHRPGPVVRTSRCARPCIRRSRSRSSDPATARGRDIALRRSPSGSLVRGCGRGTARSRDATGVGHRG